MTTETIAIGLERADRFAWLRRAGFGFALGAALLVVAALAFLVGLGVAYDGRVLPGVSVSGVELAGLDRTAAEAKLREALPALDSGRLTVTLDGQSRAITYRDLGRDYDLAGMLDAAFAIGRTGSPLERAADEARGLLRGLDVRPVAIYDAAALTAELARTTAALETPAVDAAVSLGKDGHFSVAPSATGLAVDGAAGLAAIDEALASPTSSDLMVVLKTQVALPAVTTAEAQAAVLQATQLSAANLKLEAGGTHLTIPAATVRGWLDFDAQSDGTLVPVVDVARVQASLATLATQFDRAPKNAGFKMTGSKVTAVVPAIDGRTLDVPTSAGRLAAVLQATAPGSSPGEISLAFSAVPAKLTTAAAQAILPKMHLISAWTTRFVPSDHNFFGKNISVPTTMINGTVIAPGETFDFWKVVKISRAAGFGPGGAIINGHTEPTGALGGGICSCSTTLFNAALRAGLQMGARANHYYYIDRYPKGLDATVFISDGGWTQDMTWTNDTPYPILIRGINTPAHVTFQLYSASLGRKVLLSTPIVKNYRAASDSVQYTKSLAPGVRYRVEYPTAGFDSWVTRTVVDVATGKVIHKETYYSHYARITGLLLIGI
ncbi:MAG: VanW family protein [Candidatus Limnocylindrales bacterium]